MLSLTTEPPAVHVMWQVLGNVLSESTLDVEVIKHDTLKRV